jgi:hypothetical protein
MSVCLCTTTIASGRPIQLFDGESLAGWGCFSLDPAVKMRDVWSVQEGVLICKGEPLGYLYTNEEYRNYMLIVEWRWAPGKEPGNSGLFLRILGDAVSFLPRCAECQLKSGTAGDILGFYGFEVKGPTSRLKIIDHPKLGRIYKLGKIAGAEKQPGEWNRAEVTVTGSSIIAVVNGREVNRATGCDVVTGKIGLQSEGGEIHFRTVELIPLED